ncbi:MAG: outer membrane beta-barrel family protein [Lutibacter sp.]|uniref:TonB-dependent receptor domain-containing protein n=1 Tax=Lutibacter sp. TaxID=1925666 RepID=UPI00385A9A07
MRRLFLVLIISIPSLIFSQQKNNPHYTISGKIIDASTQLPLEDATIIFKSIDSTHIYCGTITNKRGRFSIEVEKGKYNASIEFLSYKTKKLTISSINRNLNIGTIELEIDMEFLNEIEIIGEKSTIAFKRNKVIYTVGKDISSNGGVATDILNNIPLVSVDPNGGITLRGFDTPTVLINGKTSSLSKADALKTIPANSIEKIEVLTNPGAKYKASSTGIINIILKKEKDDGLNASITAAGGYKDHYGGMLTLNHKSKKVNFYTNASYFHRNPINIATYENEYFENDVTTSFLNEYSENNNKANAFYSTIGADFYLSNKATVTTSLNYTNINNEGLTITNSSIFDASKVLTESNIRNYVGVFDDEIFEFIIDYQQLFEKEGQKLTAHFIYSDDNEIYNNIITNSNTLSFTNEDYIEDNNLKNNQISVDFTNPIGKSSTYNIGYSGEFGKVPFTYIGTSGDNFIDYQEDVHAAYIEFENEGEKFYIGLGLRAEFSTYKINYQTLNTTLTKTFNDFFPSTYLEYSFSDTKALSLSYNRKIQRPGYYELQPFEQLFSETSSYIGNPNLNPIYKDAATLTYSYNGNKLTIVSSLFFNRYNDYWQDVTYETGEQINNINKIITTPVNLGKVDIYGASLTAIIKASKSLNFTASANIYNFDQTGIFKTVNEANQPISINYNQASINGFFSLLTQVKIPNLFNFQTNVKHNLISEGPVSTRKAYTYANATISKDLFKKEASISLTVDDLFLSKKTDRDRFDANYFSKSLIQNKYRTIILSFTYRFNQSKKDRKIDFDKKEIKPNY